LAGNNDADNEEENNDLIAFDLYNHKTAKNRSTLYGHNEKFDWIGSTNSKQNKAQGSKYQSSNLAIYLTIHRYVLGFYNKNSKDITLVEAENVFNLEQHAKDEKVPDDEADLQKPQMRAVEQKKLLVEEFGNTRSKKMMDAYKTSIVTVRQKYFDIPLISKGRKTF